MPCVFLRLQGCNMWTDGSKPSAICPFCDTPQLHRGKEMTLSEIRLEVFKLTPVGFPCGLVISGGEPLLQLDERMIAEFTELFEWIDVETNGSVPAKFVPPTYGNVSISCSPKTTSILVQHVDWFKILIPDKRHILAKISEAARRLYIPIYLQPTEVGGPDSAISKQNLEEAVNLCLTQGYSLSLQLHKLIGLK